MSVKLLNTYVQGESPWADENPRIVPCSLIHAIGASTNAVTISTKNHAGKIRVARCQRNRSGDREFIMLRVISIPERKKNPVTATPPSEVSAPH